MEALLTLLKIDSSELVKDFEKASLQGKGTPQEVADFREKYFKKFMEKYYPFPYRTTKGKVFDSYGNISDSIDCLVINPIHPYTIDVGDKFSIIFADGVDIAIEIKPDISDINELLRGLSQINSVKKLRRRFPPAFKETEHGFFPGYKADVVEYSRTIPSIIFSMKAKPDITKTLDDIVKYYANENINHIEQIDYIIINNKGIIANYKYSEMSLVTDKDGNEQTGLFYEEWGDLTLAAFLLKIEASFDVTPTLIKHGQFLKYYIGDIRPTKIYGLEK